MQSSLEPKDSIMNFMSTDEMPSVVTLNSARFVMDKDGWHLKRCVNVQISAIRTGSIDSFL